jgi:NAD(P)-dependent dehydrogenase (short-subunit alcohol dehydrogenase family)
MKTIDGAVAFVAGGSSGIGLGIAKALAREGARIAFTFRREDHRQEALAQLRDLGVDPLPVRLDVTDRAAVKQAAAQVEQALGPVDILCNSAGVSMFGPMEKATFEDWDWVFGVNVGGVINCLNAFLPRMIERREGGHIVTVGSMAAFLPGPEAGVYSASKCAARGITESLHYSLARHNIGVSLVSPGLVNSNIHEAFMSRPAAFKATGMPSGEAIKEPLRELMSHGLCADEVGRMTAHGIMTNSLYVFTHPEHAEDLAELHAEIMTALPNGTAPPGRLEIESRRRRSQRDCHAKALNIAASRTTDRRASTGSLVLRSPGRNVP